jgi:heterogeneous nuclear ribonucleoprotein U-like protein 1
MIGLPGAGKTFWAERYKRQHPEMKINILGTNSLIERMKVQGLPRKSNYSGRWEVLINKVKS